MSRKEHGWAAAPAIGVLLWIAVGSPRSPRAGGGHRLGEAGRLPACLDAKAKAWIGAKVELVVNDDPDMGAIDDAAVARVGDAGAEGAARPRRAAADAASELQFMRYMAHWRDHIYTAAEEIRRRGRPD